MRKRLLGRVGAIVVSAVSFAAVLAVAEPHTDDAERPPSFAAAASGEQLRPMTIAVGEEDVVRFLPHQTLDQSFNAMSINLTLDFSKDPFPLKEGDQVRFFYTILNAPRHVVRTQVQFKPIDGTDYDGQTRDEWFLVGGSKYPGEYPVHTVTAPAGLRGAQIGKIVVRWAFEGGTQSADLRVQIRIKRIEIKSGSLSIAYSDGS